MAKDLTNLKNQMAPATTTAPSAPAKTKTIIDLLAQMKGQIEKALPKHLNVDRFSRIALTMIRTNPDLLKCSQESFIAALMQSAQLGLEPGLLGQAYLIPYKGECKFIIGYQGFLSLVRRSGKIKDIYAEIIYEKDIYKITFGLNRVLEHTPNFEEDRGKPKFAYAVAKLEDDNVAFVILPAHEIEKIKKASSSAHTSYSPWQTWPEEMWKKSALKRLCKYLPLSVEDQAGIAADETVKREIAPNMVIDVAAVRMDSAEEQAKEIAANAAEEKPKAPESNEADEAAATMEAQKIETEKDPF